MTPQRADFHLFAVVITHHCLLYIKYSFLGIAVSLRNLFSSNLLKRIRKYISEQMKILCQLKSNI